MSTLDPKKILLALASLGLFVICSGYIWNTGSRALESAQSVLSDFEQVTGTSIEKVNLDPTPREAVIGWWEEYRIEPEVFERLAKLAEDYKNKSSVSVATGAIKSLDSKELESLAGEFRDLAAQHQHSDLQIESFPADAYPGIPFFVRTHSDEKRLGLADQMIIVGWIPDALRSKIPATGRLEHPHASAELREYTGWNGKPVGFDLLRESALEIADSGLGSKAWEKIKREVTKATSSVELLDVLGEHDLWTTSDGNFKYRSVAGLSFPLIRAGKIPPPKALPKALHDTLRASSLAGVQPIQRSGSYNLSEFDQALEAFSQATNIDMDTIVTGMLALRARSWTGPFAIFVAAGLSGATTNDRLISLAGFTLMIASAVLLWLMRPWLKPWPDIFLKPGIETAYTAYHDISEEEPMDSQKRPGAAPAPDTTSNNASSLQPVAAAKVVPDATSLSPTNVGEVLQTLNNKGPFGRAFELKKQVHIARQAKEIIEASTEVISAQADQIKTVLRNQNEIDELQDEATLRDLKLEAKKAELKAKISGHKFEEEKSHQDRRVYRDSNCLTPALVG